MKGYLLDTNIVSYILRGDANVSKMYHDKLQANNPIAISTICHYEVLGGLYAINATRKLDQYHTLLAPLELLPFNAQMAIQAANIYAELRKRGQIVDDIDLLISATAIAADLTLVTHNTRHFERVPALKLEDWTV